VADHGVNVSRTEPVLDGGLLASIAKQMFAGDEVEVGGMKVRVGRTSRQRLRTVTFQIDGRGFEAIEQNADKPSRWGQLARAGHQVVQFKDTRTNRFVAVGVDGEVKEYVR
jgi:hypothetical protein